MSTMEVKNKPLSRHVITAFLSGQAVSLLGSSLVQFAIIWYVTLQTNSATSMTIITVTSLIPQLLVAPLAGVWADRYDRRWLIMLSDGGIALATAWLMIMALRNGLQMWMIYLVSAIRSLGGGIQSPANQALIPQITPEDKLVRINGIYSTISNMLMLLSPILGGVLLSLTPIWSVFLVDVITAIVGISIMFFIPIPHQITGKIVNALGNTPRLKEGECWGFPESRLDAVSSKDASSQDMVISELEALESGLSKFNEGFSYVNKIKPLRNLMLTYAGFMLMLSPVITLIPLFIRRHFGIEVWYITATETALFAGMAIGGLLVSFKGYFRSCLRTVRTSGLLVAMVMLTVSLLAIFESILFSIFAVLALLLGMIVPFYSTAVTTLFQREVESEYHGRVFALLYMIGSAAIPLGSILLGPLADFISIEYIFLAAAVIQIVLMLTSLKTVPNTFEIETALIRTKRNRVSQSEMSEESIDHESQEVDGAVGHDLHNNDDFVPGDATQENDDATDRELHNNSDIVTEPSDQQLGNGH
jgi:DHA3 family macrolide efflux protein-like MFS transporter